MISLKKISNGVPMKKYLKIILSVVIIITIYIIIDIVYIFNFNRPLITIKGEKNVYKSIFYNVYDCLEYPTVQIKPKYVKYNCVIPNK